MRENHRTMDLNHLIDLDALLSEGSVAGAAKKLHLSAPAMSRRLAHLRHALGDPLFVHWTCGNGCRPPWKMCAAFWRRRWWTSAAWNAR